MLNLINLLLKFGEENCFGGEYSKASVEAYLNSRLFVKVGFVIHTLGESIKKERNFDKRG